MSIPTMGPAPPIEGDCQTWSRYLHENIATCAASTGFDSSVAVQNMIVARHAERSKHVPVCMKCTNCLRDTGICASVAICAVPCLPFIILTRGLATIALFGYFVENGPICCPACCCGCIPGCEVNYKTTVGAFP